MKKLITAGLLLAIMQIIYTSPVQAQLTSLPSGGNKRASVSEGIGITNVSITYSLAENRKGCTKYRDTRYNPFNDAFHTIDDMLRFS